MEGFVPHGDTVHKWGLPVAHSDFLLSLLVAVTTAARWRGRGGEEEVERKRWEEVAAGGRPSAAETEAEACYARDPDYSAAGSTCSAYQK